MTTETSAILATAPTLREVAGTWAKIGVLSFGGPTAQIALMHRVIVDEKRWLTEQQYLNALSFCMLLPGPEAMQLATYVGWRLHGVAGGLIAGLLFVLPGAAVVLTLSMIYAAFGSVPLMEAVFLGIKAAVLVIVVEALLRIARRALKGRQHWITAAATFVALFFFGAPFPLLILLAAVAGFLAAAPAAPEADLPARVSTASTVTTIAVWGLAWATPLVTIAMLFGTGHVLTQLSLLFSKLAVVTFGGAYAGLVYLGQDVVTKYGWIDAKAMMDGLGLAETTPGPLILVTEFVGYLSAYHNGGEPAWLMGLLGAFVALWATFVPCFLWIFAAAPYIEWITRQPRIRGALESITAAVVGVILNLAVWFGLHVFFKTVTLTHAGPLSLWIPDATTLDWRVVVLGALSAYLLLWRHWSIPAVLGVSAGLALAFASASSPGIFATLWG